MTFLNASTTEQTIKNGTTYDQNLIKVLGLKADETYKVKSIYIGRSRTEVILEDFPDYRFNSVNFKFTDDKNEAVDIFKDIHRCIYQTYVVPWNNGTTMLNNLAEYTTHQVERALDTFRKL